MNTRSVRAYPPAPAPPAPPGKAGLEGPAQLNTLRHKDLRKKVRLRSFPPGPSGSQRFPTVPNGSVSFRFVPFGSPRCRRRVGCPRRLRR